MSGTFLWTCPKKVPDMSEKLVDLSEKSAGLAGKKTGFELALTESLTRTRAATFFGLVKQVFSASGTHTWRMERYIFDHR